MRVTEELVSRTRSAGKRVALTFDDGPDPVYTPQVLDALAEHGVPATFCLIGVRARAHPALVGRIVAGGHAVCNHSLTHADLVTLAPEQVHKEIAEANAIITDVAQVPVRHFRSPFGGWSTTVRITAAECGLQPLDWSVNPCDWSRPGVSEIVGIVHRDLRPGGVILMHDAACDVPDHQRERDQTVAAVRRLIPALTEQGYAFDLPALPGEE